MRKIFIDCPEQIPCNPCVHICPVGAITIEGSITNLPKGNKELCTGCGLCVAACPGQACFLVDTEFKEGFASVDFPYEFLPLPTVGMTVKARDNEGQTLTDGTVEAVIQRESSHQTAIIRISVPTKYAYLVRGIKPITDFVKAL
ncbi:MAG: 4Fe-4S dicluster domain-containing protein [Lachnospiraceae bacterium]|jgi:Fe-S-cluster-containing hydrogenase component 2|nr:4Fe-4S dicluster domain-containing protein [Lachnospiraceae bacterium]